MRRYKNLFNILALCFLAVFFVWLFSFASPGYTKHWKPKHSMKYATKVELKTPMKLRPLDEVLFPPKSEPFEEVCYE